MRQEHAVIDFPTPADIQDRSKRMSALGGRPKRRYPWDAARDAFVQGHASDGHHRWRTLEAVADQFEIAPARVRARSAAKGWVAERDAFRGRVEVAAAEARVAALANARLDLDVAGLETAMRGIGLVRGQLDALGRRTGNNSHREGRATTEDEDGRGLPCEVLVADARALKSLADTLGTLFDVAARAIGESSADARQRSGHREPQLTQRPTSRQQGRVDVPNRLAAFLAGLDQALAGSTRAADTYPGLPIRAETGGEEQTGVRAS